MKMSAVLRELMAAGLTGDELVAAIERIETEATRFIPPAMRELVLSRDGYRCTYCGVEEPSLHCDHVIPLSRGGPTKPDNLVAACKSCNSAKKDRTPDEWRRK